MYTEYEAYETEQKKIMKEADSYERESFAADVSERLSPMIKKGNRDVLKELLLESWDAMSQFSKVLLLDKSVFSEFMEQRGERIDEENGKIAEDMKGDKSLERKWEEGVNKFRENAKFVRNLEKEIETNKMHRNVLEPILESALSELNFKRNKNEMKWKGIEIGNAATGGFGERTSYKSLGYQSREQGMKEKETIITALAVYFIDLIRAKQTTEFKIRMRKFNKKENQVSTEEIMEILKDIKNEDYK